MGIKFGKRRVKDVMRVVDGTPESVTHHDIDKVDGIIASVFPDMVAVIPAEPEPGIFVRTYLFRHPDLVTHLEYEYRVVALYNAKKREVSIFEQEPNGRGCFVTPEPMSLAEIDEAGGVFVMGVVDAA